MIALTHASQRFQSCVEKKRRRRLVDICCLMLLLSYVFCRKGSYSFGFFHARHLMLWVVKLANKLTRNVRHWTWARWFVKLCFFPLLAIYHLIQAHQSPFPFLSCTYGPELWLVQCLVTGEDCLNLATSGDWPEAQNIVAIQEDSPLTQHTQHGNGQRPLRLWRQW